MNLDCPRVALLIETSRGYGRAMLRGIVRFARLHGPWSFYITPGDFEQALPKMSQWGGAGIIARVETVEVARAILAADVPTVLVGVEARIMDRVPKLAELCEISSDSEGAARMAADHLLSRGFENFAYVGLWERGWSERRQAAFCAAIRSASFEPIIYPLPKSQKQRGWELEQSSLAEWIQSLPKPVAIMACNDDRGRGVLEACRFAGVRVPEEVAVIGIDDDDLFCELADPPLSSVALNAEHGGYRVAHLLDQLIRGKVEPPQKLIVEPTHVVARRSTEIKAIGDREVGGAMDFIHRNRARNFTVSDVAAEIGVSRRNLEVKFRRSTGRTILAEIQRIRLDHAKRMLRDTDIPIPQIAAASGYSSASYLTQVFRKELGITPARYRTRFRV
ncbi:MAG: substrate-binding domain-containing protein [Pirellulales bacterium]